MISQGGANMQNTLHSFIKNWEKIKSVWKWFSFLTSIYKIISKVIFVCLTNSSCSTVGSPNSIFRYRLHCCLVYSFASIPKYHICSSELNPYFFSLSAYIFVYSDLQLFLECSSSCSISRFTFSIKLHSNFLLHNPPLCF